MESHKKTLVNQLFLWPCSIVCLYVYQRVSGVHGEMLRDIRISSYGGNPMALETTSIFFFPTMRSQSSSPFCDMHVPPFEDWLRALVVRQETIVCAYDSSCTSCLMDPSLTIDWNWYKRRQPLLSQFPLDLFTDSGGKSIGKPPQGTLCDPLFWKNPLPSFQSQCHSDIVLLQPDVHTLQLQIWAIWL